MGRLVFSPDEILRLAIKIEDNGKKFYEGCLGNVDEPKIKNVLSLLIEQETQHKKIFADMLKESENFVVESYASDYEAFMVALAREAVFAEELVKKKIEEGFSGVLELLDFALRIEKDSIILYTQFSEIVRKNIKSLDEIIQEELRHFIWISRLKSQYK